MKMHHIGTVGGANKVLRRKHRKLILYVKKKRVKINNISFFFEKLEKNVNTTDMKMETKTNLNRMPFYSGLLLHCLIMFLKLENYMQ